MASFKWLPGIVAIVGAVMPLLNLLFFSVKIDFNYIYFPTISEVGKDYPERIIFCIALNFIAYGLLPLIYERWSTIHSCYSKDWNKICTVVIFFVTLMFVAFLTLTSACSFADHRITHDVFAGGAFVSVLLVSIMLYIQDWIKSTKRVLLVIRGIGLFFIFFWLSALAIAGIVHVCISTDTTNTILAVFEYLSYYTFLGFISTYIF